MKSPEPTPQGKEYLLHLEVRDDTASGLLARLTNDETRQTMPSFLFVTSRQAYALTIDDVYDGYSHKDFIFRSYKRKIDDYKTHSFRAEEGVELDNRVLRLNVRLGAEAASRILIAPFFAPTTNEYLEVEYHIPGFEPIDMGVVDDIEAYMAERPQGVYKGLTVVPKATALHSLYHHSQYRDVRPDAQSFV